MKSLPSGLNKCPRSLMCIINWNIIEHCATGFAVFKHFRSTVQFMYSAADSTTGCTDCEACNGTGSSHWPYNYK